MKTEIGLRIDVDTFRGTHDGVPNLCRLFKEEDIKATFFFSVGPDNMGRHLWRLLKPAFLWKMLRTNAASLYGFDIIFKGTFWPGPNIGRKLKDIIKDTVSLGHEIGLHAWDHHRWQSKIEKMSSEEIYSEIEKGVNAIKEITGSFPSCSAAPGWKCTEEVLLQKEKFPFEYNTDCREATEPFIPVADGKELTQPQIPVTLPTYDEVLGKNGITNENYNEFMLSQLKKDSLNILTIHAEAEGISCLEMFREFVRKAKEMDYEFVPLCGVVQDKASLKKGSIKLREIPGREGVLACADVNDGHK